MYQSRRNANEYLFKHNQEPSRSMHFDEAFKTTDIPTLPRSATYMIFEYQCWQWETAVQFERALERCVESKTFYLWGFVVINH